MNYEYKKRLYFLNFETGGLNEELNPPMSLHVERWGDPQGETFYFYPQSKVYTWTALQVNGLSLDDLYANGKGRENMIRYFKHLAESHGKFGEYIVLCGWNVTFDIKFLLKAFSDKDKHFPLPIIAVDLKEIFEKKKYPQREHRKWISLVDAYQEFFSDFEPYKAHTAEYDVYMCKKLFNMFEIEEWI